MHAQANQQILQTQQIQEQLKVMLDQGMAAHRSGQIDAARKIYQHILELKPDHADTLHLYGVTAHQLGDYAQSAQLIR
ncbi:tetratricopeptide repeat protein [Undibacterium sp. Ji42W]|uniref:tetratricopeptide repeat protein n=1 Tax=Undibacterium sp. Ji42W TaxID=3413039 RepID=UPI003BEFA51B